MGSRRLGAIARHLQPHPATPAGLDAKAAGTAPYEQAAFERAERQRAESAGVPVCDVGPLLDPAAPAAARAALLAKIDSSFRHGSGAIIATGHGLNASLAEILGGSRRFFASGPELQAPHVASKAFTPVGAAKIAIRPSTLHERLSYPRVCYDTDGVSAADLATVGSKLDASAPPLFEPFPGLDDAFREYQRGLRGLVKGILAAVAELLEIDGQELLEGWRHTSSGITVLHYPEEDPAALPTSDGFSGGGRSDTLRFGPAARDDNGARTDQGANDERAGGDQPTQGDLGASMRAYPHSDGDTMMVRFSSILIRFNSTLTRH